MLYNSNNTSQALRRIECTLKSKNRHELKRIKSKIWDIEKVYRSELLQHEISTPLTTLMMLITEIRPGSIITWGNKEHIQANVQQIMAILKSDSTFEKSEKFNLSHIVKECTKISRIENCHINILPKYENILIKGNSCKFRQILINVFNNARESTMSIKKIQITIEKKGEWNYIEIRNKLASEKMNILNKVPVIGTSKKQGLVNKGLGIMLCKKLVEQDFSGTLRTTLTLDNTFTVILKFPRRKINNV